MYLNVIRLMYDNILKRDLRWSYFAVPTCATAEILYLPVGEKITLEGEIK